MELSGVLLPVAIMPRQAVPQSAGFSTCVIMIDDLGNDIDPLFLADIFSEFFLRNIPISCVVDVAALKSGENDRLVALINATMLREVGLFEIVLAISDIGDERRYFQMRTAESLRAAAAQVFGNGRDHPVASVIDRGSEDRIDLSAYRSAGFRVLVRPQHADTLAAEFVGRRQLRLLGGTILRLADLRPDVLARLNESLTAGTDTLVVLSLSGIAEVGAPEVLSQVAAITATIESSMATGSVFVTRPMDYLLQFGPRQPTELALVVAAGETAEEMNTARIFVEALAGNALPVTVTAATRPAWLPGTAAFCPIWPGGDPNFVFDTATQPDCVLLTDPVPEAELPPVPVIVAGAGQGWSWNGLRADGRMQVALSNWTKAGLSGGSTLDNLAVLIKPADIMTKMQRDTILRQVLAAHQNGRIRFHTIASLADDLLAPEPVLTRLWSTRRRRVTDPARGAVMANAERARLRDDAQLAWRYIDRFTSPLTGLCAGTVQEGPAMRINREATLWDLASQIQGIIAASFLDIIPRHEATARLITMLANMPVSNLAGLNLPPAMFLTDSSKAIVTPGFDICDTGRFLIALRAAVAAGLVPAETAAATLNAWDLGAAVQDRHPFNHDGTNWHDVTQSHCTPYIGRAFAQLGLPMISPYMPAGTGNVTGTATDDLIRLLYAAAFIGSYGTEPLLLEAIELGASPQSAFLADVLFDAQLAWFETTGQLKCVSESPLNTQPWFIFQGLRVDRLGAKAWTIKSLDRAEAFQTEAFVRDAEVLSTKSAYLWAATHPHPYSDRIIRLIRDKARIDNFGFSVGVFARTLLPMKDYSDLNTNGIILTAIASMLGST